MRLFKRLAITAPSFANNASLVAEAKQLAENTVITTSPPGVVLSEDQLLTWLTAVQPDALVVGSEPITRRLIHKLPGLKAIGKYGVGCENIDLEALNERSIHFEWTGGVNKRSVAELCLGFMIGHCHNQFRSIDRMQKGQWIKNGGMQLDSLTIGIVGFGHVGTELAKLLRPFGSRLLTYDIVDKRSAAEALDVSCVPSFGDLLRESDVLSFHVPGGNATKHLFNKTALTQVKSSLLVINTSRGSVVDFEATAEAVLTGKISGFASDVFPSEPFSSTNYRIEQGFYFTPHIGGNTKEAVAAMGSAALTGLRSYLEKVS